MKRSMLPTAKIRRVNNEKLFKIACAFWPAAHCCKCIERNIDVARPLPMKLQLTE